MTHVPADPQSLMTWCSEHNAHVGDCFPLHHEPPPKTPTIPVVFDREAIRLPCGHLADRPEPTTFKRHLIVCSADDLRWMVVWDGSGTWTAQAR